MKAFSSLASLCLLAVPVPALGQAQSADAPAAAEQRAPLAASGDVVEEPAISEVAAQQQKRVCKTERITGSLTRRIRTCMTQAEWDRLAEGSRRGMEDIVRDGALADSRRCFDHLGHCSNQQGDGTLPGLPPSN